MKELYIIRHGETDYNAKRIIQGSGVDSSLNEKGKAQAQAFFKKYQSIPFELVVTSNLKRTHQTVAPFVEKKGLSWVKMPEINEMSWGVHEGKSGTPELKKDYLNMIQEWSKGNYAHALKGAESALDLANRMQRFKEYIQSRQEQTMLICSHGRAMRCMTAVLLDEPLYQMEKYHHENTGLYKFIFDGQFHLDTINDTSHLEG